MVNVDEGIEILENLGVPDKQQNERSALTLIALLDLEPSDNWDDSNQVLRGIHDIMVFINSNYGRNYAENTRESIRKHTIHQFEQGGIVVKNPDNPSRPTNSPNTVYKVTDKAFEAITRFNSQNWEEYLENFLEEKGRLIEKYEMEKKEHQISIEAYEESLEFSPGKHNELQAKALIGFQEHFFPEAEIVYVGDTANKMLKFNEDLASKLDISIEKHNKLPDIVLYDEKRDFLLLIEAVTSRGPMSPKRVQELEKFLSDSKPKKIYITAFNTFKEFKRHMEDLAWETEVWIAERPSHMVHYNGEDFIEVKSKTED